MVRKLAYGDVDLGIVGYDMLSELAHSNPDLIVLHDALGFGKCHLGLGVPMGGRFTDVHSLEDLRRYRAGLGCAPAMSGQGPAPAASSEAPHCISAMRW